MKQKVNHFYKKSRERLSLRIKKFLGLIQPPAIFPYAGWGNQREAWVYGHVMENRSQRLAKEEDSIWKNMKSSVARYISDPIPAQEVTIQFLGRNLSVYTDEDGFFQGHYRFEGEIDSFGWQDVFFSLQYKSDVIKAHTTIYLEEKKSQFGVISDIDDTILISHSTKLLRKLRLILTKNAITRSPYLGVSEFYRLLHNHTNPFFYVSSSEYNLYDFLRAFFYGKKLPRGPFLLQEYKSGLGDLIGSGGGTHEHKFVKIKHLFEVYSTLTFILIGDSGQQDLQIYQRIVNEFPGRVLAIYIREVGTKNKGHLRKIADEIRDVDVVFAENTQAAKLHAIEKGFIPEEAMEIKGPQSRDSRF